MSESKRPRKRAGEQPPYKFHAHLIRIPDLEARKRATMILGEVPRPYCGLPDFQFVVTNDHFKALKKAKIPFEVL